MQDAQGRITEIYLHALKAARIACPASLIPGPGQYVLAYAQGSDAPLAIPLFPAALEDGAFIAAAPIPADWQPGLAVHLRGPLGRGFAVPAAARKLALVAVDGSAARLLALLERAVDEDRSAVLVCDQPPEDLPLQIEVQPERALLDVLQWAEYAAFDLSRAGLPDLQARLAGSENTLRKLIAQVLVRTPLPCGGLADCGACAVGAGRDQWLACKDGPVFTWQELAE
jgi:NAD(P)H-flavin reductase